MIIISKIKLDILDIHGCKIGVVRGKNMAAYAVESRVESIVFCRCFVLFCLLKTAFSGW